MWTQDNPLCSPFGQTRSAIFEILHSIKDDNYKWDEHQAFLSTLTKACRKINDTVHLRQPVKRLLLELILFEVGRYWKNQPYLITLYWAFFALSYYGLFAVGELTKGDHLLKACDVHVADNKGKMLFILRTSKTHGK